MVYDDFSRLIALAFNAGVLKRLVLSRPTGEDLPIKITGRLCRGRRGNILALEMALPGDTVSQKNLTEDEIVPFILELLPKYRQTNLLTTVQDAELKISKKGETVALGLEKLYRKLSQGTEGFEKTIEELDRKKSYILSGNESFLISLGISDKSGRVHDKRQGKFRQINKFLEYLEEVYPKLPCEGELTVYDLCCGKSYLSFAVYYYLTVIKSRSVYMLGIDLKRDVISFCNRMAAELGFSGMHFICDDIGSTPGDRAVDLVISLHACDVATDIVLAKATELGAGVILSTPCCHKDLADRINSEELSFATRFPKLKGKLCEALTDALRLMRLEAYGYSVSATELVDPEDTPKNTLLRAIKAREPKESLMKDYEEKLKFLMGEGYTEYPGMIKEQ